MNHKLILSIFILLGITLVSACGPGPAPSPTITSTATSTIIPTPTPMPTPTPPPTATAPSDAEEKTGVFLKKIYESENGGSIPYQFYIPQNSSKDQLYPLVLFLHGAGELGNDNRSQMVGFPHNFADARNQKDYPAFFLAPQCPVGDAWASFPGYPDSTTSPQPTHPTRLTIELIEKVLSEYNIDPQRIYVIGLSLGGEGTFDIVSRRPDLFAAAVPICGIADIARASDVKDVSFWIFHGEKDDINSVTYSRMMVQALEDIGVSPKYTEYAGSGHSIWNRVYLEPELLPWMFSQRKK
jgi:predicted peptidase